MPRISLASLCILLLTHTLLVPALLVPALLAQGEYRYERDEDLKIRFKVHKKLSATPLKLGEVNPHLRRKYEPKDPGDYIFGQLGTYEWYVNIYEFPKRAAGETKPEATTEGGTTTEGAKEAIKSLLLDKLSAANWQAFVTEKDDSIKNRQFILKGQSIKQRGKVPAHTWWEYSDTTPASTGKDLIWYKGAAAYDFPKSEVVIVVNIPINDTKSTKPDAKYLKWIHDICESLEPFSESELAATNDDGESADVAAKEKFADTPQKKAELEKAKNNIQSFDNWDYFTTKNYIVLFGWDREKKDLRKENLKFSRGLVNSLEQMRELYLKDYPPHENMLSMYSVLRVCDNAEEFMRYGSTSWGVVGWFSPATKELVVFDDKQRYYGGDKDVYATTMHEGWHQYGHSYFGESAELHRWFDEGSGDFYGSNTKAGGKWSYKVDKGRKTSIASQIARKNYIPLREIVGWSKDKFYGPRAPDHYAEGYSLVDFFRRGPDVLGKKFDPAWGKVLETYRLSMLETKNQKTAVEKAFEGVDFDKLEAAWMDWVKTNMK